MENPKLKTIKAMATRRVGKKYRKGTLYYIIAYSFFLEGARWCAKFKKYPRVVIYTEDDINRAFFAGYDLNTWEQLEAPNKDREYLNVEEYIQYLKVKRFQDLENKFRNGC